MTTGKEAVMFMMSMSDSMGLLMPAPIEMDATDEFQSENERKSRWAMCSETIRLMTNQMVGYPIDVLLAKNSELGVTVTRGNCEGFIHPIINQLKTLTTLTRASGRCDPEHAMQEFQKFDDCADYTETSIHWFIDAESFLNFDPSIIMRRFETLTIYVVGELRTLHDGEETIKKNCATWIDDVGVKVRFLTCGADFEDLKVEISNEERLEIREKSVECQLLSEKFEIQLLGKCQNGSVVWPCDAVVVVGFISDIELSRLSVVGQQKNVDDVFNVSTKSDMGNEMLWSLAEYMMGDVKQPMSCLCVCLQDGDVLEYALLVADVEEHQYGISLVRTKALTQEKVQELEHVMMIGDASEGLPDETEPEFAPMEQRIIKKRLADILEASKDDVVAKQAKYTSFVAEYEVLGADEQFKAFTATWRNDNNVIIEDN